MTPAGTAGYIMEDPREGSRLEQKIDPQAWVRTYLAPHLIPGAHILDVGSGPGTLLRAAVSVDRRSRGTGVDLGPARVREAQIRHADMARLQFRRGNVQQLEFESGTFDLVYTRMLLQYVDYPIHSDGHYDAGLYRRENKNYSLANIEKAQ